MARKRIQSTEKMGRDFGGDDFRRERNSRLGAVRVKDAAPATTTVVQASQADQVIQSAIGQFGGGSQTVIGGAPVGAEYILGSRSLQLPGSRWIDDSSTIVWDRTDPAKLYANIAAGVSLGGAAWDFDEGDSSTTYALGTIDFEGGDST